MAKVRYEIGTLRATDSGSALGQIWIETGERSLPSARWDDFIVFVLDWWRLGIRNLLTGSEEPAIFAFMDDPYELWIRPERKVYFYTWTFHDEEIASGRDDRAGMLDLVTSYLDCVRAVLAQIEKDKAWRKTYDGSEPQIEDLRAELPKFEALLEQFRNDKTS